ncbi:MAG: HYR domain-containing protein, partial [Phaeodactylibacter sp.]|nr:HYR domain-containing protein [Phaeodactylibacter sp.]
MLFCYDTFDTLGCSQNLLVHREWTLVDVCGNVTVDTQLIYIVDTVPPSYIAPPDTVFDSCNDINNIAITGSPNNVVENCGIGSFFFINQFYNQTCVNSYNIRRLWILQDDCGNADTSIQILIVRDTVPPQIIEPAEDVTISCTTEAQAVASFNNWIGVLGFALANDDCSDANLTWNAYNSGTLNPPTLPPADCSNGPGVYRTRTVDFVVKDECGNQSVTTATFSITDTQPPQIVSCPNNITVPADMGQCSATVGLPPAVATENCGSVPVTMEYTVNDGPRMPMDAISGLIDVFEVGENVVEYYVIDCSGNESTCTFLVTVEDTQAPQISCPPGFNLNTEPDLCEATTFLPLPISVSDNCGAESMYLQEQPTSNQAQFMTFSLNSITGSYVAEDKDFVFTNVPSSAFGDVHLTVRIRGDIDEPGEFFQILDPNGASLGITEIGQPNVQPGDCNTVSTVTFTLPAAYFNSIVSNSTVTFTAESNSTFTIPVSPDDGINPCNPGNVGQNGDTDGQSLISMTLEVTYEEYLYYTDGATVIPPTPVLDNEAPEHTLSQGVTTVYYVVSDIAGNMDTCSYDIEVIDNQDPEAFCQPSIITINPSGFEQAEIMPADLNMGSTDNCGIDSMYVSSPIITCDMIGDT